MLLTTAGENSGTWWPPICFSRTFFLVPFCPKLATKFFLCLHQVGYVFFFLEGTSKIFQRGRENSNFHPYKLEMLQFEHWLNHQLEQRCLIPGEEFQFVIPLSITADVKRPPVLRKTATLESGDGGGFAPLFLEVSSWRKVRDCIQNFGNVGACVWFLNKGCRFDILDGIFRVVLLVALEGQAKRRGFIRILIQASERPKTRASLLWSNFAVNSRCCFLV